MSSSFLKLGAAGNDVKTLKQLLRSTGYRLNDDDLYDEDTYNAVMDYQTANGLTANGEAGASTWAKLAGSIASSLPAGSGAKDSVKYLENNRPKAFSSDYTAHIDQLVDKILNREDFSYDPRQDPMYQNYKDSYMYLGKKAMNDAIGTAAQLSGGYMNTYAQAAGEQAYQDYLASLSNGIPEMYKLALDAYDANTGRLQSSLKALTDREDRDYSRYLNDVDAYNDALNYYYKKLKDEESAKKTGAAAAAKPAEAQAEQLPYNILTQSEFLKRKAAGSKSLENYSTYEAYIQAMKKIYG